jgi:hypothetical protein
MTFLPSRSDRRTGGYRSFSVAEQEPWRSHRGRGACQRNTCRTTTGAINPESRPVSKSDYGSAANIFGAGEPGIRYPLDPNAEPDASEMSWGPGLVPKGLENAPPSKGGMYRGQTPPCDPIIGVSRR